MTADHEIYVVVMDNDRPVDIGSTTIIDDMGPLIMEQYTKTASHNAIAERARQLSYRYGRCRVARIEFTDEAFIDGEKQ